MYIKKLAIMLCGIMAGIMPVCDAAESRAYKPLEFVIVITSYNNEAWYERNIASALYQQQEEIPFSYEIVYINDYSTDETLTCVKKYIVEHQVEDRITLINNEERIGSLANIYKAVHTIDDHKVIVLLDGDDHLEQHALARVAREYAVRDDETNMFKDSAIWLTYGQYDYYPYGIAGVSKPFPAWVIQQQAFRQYDWITSHLKTFKAQLFKKIDKKDLCNVHGNFYSTAGDVAFMYPMIEMASQGHFSCISDIIYHYNSQNSISNHNFRRQLQIDNNREIIKKDTYQALETLD